MLSLADLSRQVLDYQRGNISLDAFEDWFRTASRGMFGENKEVLDACVAIEQAFSKLSFEGISEEDFSKELASALRPFVSYTTEAYTVHLAPLSAIVLIGAFAPEQALIVSIGANANAGAPTTRTPGNQVVGSNSAWNPIPAAAR
jgi:hypothetical protein